MPFETRWVPPDPLPEAHVELPDGWEEVASYTRARKAVSKEHNREAHLCYICGWVIGEPLTKRVSDMGFLSGREGTAYHCLRCGREIAFTGRMS